mmetsp:Transcript_7512/g.14737  ORF Transcript_7512/g.14737 Transcript_7512/m.14737 type:complete len:213 (+) Transcript_7512:267-905(+)
MSLPAAQAIAVRVQDREPVVHKNTARDAFVVVVVDFVFCRCRRCVGTVFRRVAYRECVCECIRDGAVVGVTVVDVDLVRQAHMRSNRLALVVFLVVIRIGSIDPGCLCWCLLLSPVPTTTIFHNGPGNVFRIPIQHDFYRNHGAVRYCFVVVVGSSAIIIVVVAWIRVALIGITVGGECRGWCSGVCFCWCRGWCFGWHRCGCFCRPRRWHH